MLGFPDTPGFYVQPLDRDRGAVQALRTDIAGFVGLAEKGPLGVAVPIETMRQFETLYGRYFGGGYLAYAVRAFFENGGVRCRVVRVAAPEAASAGARVRLADGRFGLRIEAATPGSWGNGLAVGIVPAFTGETLSRPGGDALVTSVASIAGFAPRALVRVAQDGVEIFAVVAAVDAARSRLHWVHPDPESRAPWQAPLPLAGFDAGRPMRISRLDFDVSVRDRGRLVAAWSRLSAVAGGQRFMADLVRMPDGLGAEAASRTLLERPPEPAPPIIAILEDGLAAGWAGVPLLAEPGLQLPLAGGIDGLALLGAADFLGGLAVLGRAQDVAMLAVPDIHIQPRITRRDLQPLPVPDPCAPCALPPFVAPPPPPPVGELPPRFDAAAIAQVQAAMLAQCETLRDRFALLDPPWQTADADRTGIAGISAWRSRFDSGFGALYFPWIAAPDPLAPGAVRMVPPSGHVAGRFAATDLAAGVHVAAANTALAWAQDSSLHTDPVRHGLLNAAGINLITTREGRLLRIMGARTMASDPLWRFVPVRRLISMLRDALVASTAWAVFEPNDDTTRLQLAEGVTGLLSQLWRAGALVGEVPEQAFRVRCDLGNNPASLRALGQLHCDIAVAPAVPMEFIVLRMGRQGNSFALVEDGGFERPLLGGDA